MNIPYKTLSASFNFSTDIFFLAMHELLQLVLNTFINTIIELVVSSLIDVMTVML